MKTVIILEADHLAIPVSELLNPKEMKLIGIGNSCPDTWNVFENPETGELKDAIQGLPVMPVDLAASLQPDIMVTAAADPEKSPALQYMAIRAGFENDIRFIEAIQSEFSVTCAVVRRLARRLKGLRICGSVAELGCYKGDMSWQLNILMPDRKLYLFDTLEGFDARDVAKEQALGCSKASVGQFGDVLSHENPLSDDIEFFPGPSGKPNPEDHRPDRPVQAHGKGYADNAHVHPNGKDHGEQHPPGYG